MRKIEKLYRRHKGRNSKRPIEAEFNLKYYTLELPAKELAKEYGVTENTIYQWAYYFRHNKEQNK